MTRAADGPRREPVVLLVLDGWGHAAPGPGNAIALSGAPRMTALAARSGCLLDASGAAVGVPEGVMGNSEVGHLTIGAGRIVEQDLVRIGRACRDGSIAALPVMQRLFDAARKGSGRLHLLGLCSDAGVHSHLDHLEAVARAAKTAGVAKVFAHAFTDGRDTPPMSAARYVERLQASLDVLGHASIATVGGRYFGMDRDRRWDRIERAYRAMTLGEAPKVESALQAVAEAHVRGIGDEFIEPVVVDADGMLRDGDAALFTNFRADRGRQLSRALADPAFDAFALPRPRLSLFATMTEYAKDLPAAVVFDPQQPKDTLGETFSKAGWPQLRVAETEKYAHVTYFFDGGREASLPGEERLLVPSQKVATYDLVPEMSARAVTDGAVAFVSRGGSRFAVVNLANADMVGHTGDLRATERACRVVDDCIGRIEDAVLAAGGALLVTADHGNAEHMLDERGGPHTAHTLAPVPCAVRDARGPVMLAARGGLSDVAPTVLDLAGIPAPAAMTGRTLLA